MAKKSVKAMSKSEIISAVAEECELSKAQTKGVFESISGLIQKGICKTGPGAFTLPGLLKIERKAIPARAARKGVPNPFKPGELMDVAAKPATTLVKVKALKGLKDMI